MGCAWSCIVDSTVDLRKRGDQGGLSMYGLTETWLQPHGAIGQHPHPLHLSYRLNCLVVCSPTSTSTSVLQSLDTNVKKMGHSGKFPNEGTCTFSCLFLRFGTMLPRIEWPRGTRILSRIVDWREMAVFLVSEKPFSRTASVRKNKIKIFDKNM